MALLNPKSHFCPQLLSDHIRRFLQVRLALLELIFQPLPFASTFFYYYLFALHCLKRTIQHGRQRMTFVPMDYFCNSPSQWLWISVTHSGSLLLYKSVIHVQSVLFKNLYHECPYLLIHYECQVKPHNAFSTRLFLACSSLKMAPTQNPHRNQLCEKG